jgi:sigma-B regulation protein RsbU (phosphoserine phosphatase)
MTLSLLPGDALFLYTDGVTEALDSKNELFGENRLTDALNTVASLGPHSICMVVRAAVAAFSEGVPQADDITVLAVRYVARPKVLVRSFPPTQAGISAASDFLDEVLADIGTLALSPLHIILDEVCSNIVKHSDATVFELDISSNGGETTLTFVDDGSPYDPLSHEDPDTSLPAGERPIGGLGIMMVKKLASSVAYRRTHNRNFFIVKRSS